jgi:hypothetical protein
MLASKSKGGFALFRRAGRIIDRYGIETSKMENALAQFVEVLCQYNCGASFPITAVVLKRNNKLISRYSHRHIEFIVHGYSHVDYSLLTKKEQFVQLQHAREVFENTGIPLTGFRSPYLCRSPYLNSVLEKVGFSYASNQPILWNVIDVNDLESGILPDYEKVIHFYNPWDANTQASLPSLNNQLIEIPVSLPDDEILVDRLNAPANLIEEIWLKILIESYQKGELFTLLLHPERIGFCASALSAVLAKAKSFSPTIWCSRLDEIAFWWKSRAAATFEITETGDGGFHFLINAPEGATVLIRSIEVDVPCVPWADNYLQVQERCFNLRSHIRPLIGISPATSPKLAKWLSQQGFFVEVNKDKQSYSCYFDLPEFDNNKEQQIISQIEKTNFPLVRLGRWPNGARSALCVTGDIDALTMWDYGFRLIGR